MDRRSSPRRLRVVVFFFLLALLMGGMIASSKVSFAQEMLDADDALAQLQAASANQLVTRTRAETGNLSYLTAPRGMVLLADDASAQPTERAIAFLQRYGSVMGIRDAAVELQVAQVVPDELGMTHIRLNQYHNGLPVFGAQVVVHMNGSGITGVNGTFIPNLTLDTTPTLSQPTAVTAALKAVQAAEPSATLASADAGLAIYRTGLLEGYVGENRLAYNVVVAGEGIKEQVWIDAVTGKVLNRISMLHTDLDRRVYLPQYDPQNPNLFVVRTEGGPPVNPLHPLIDSPPDDLYDFSGQTYNFFLNGFGRDSYDGAGGTMRTVYLINEQCPNAYWNGESTNYCPGFDVDDVVSHEWGHAYTEYTHGLIYQYQSGALNESYSDIWGETVDLFNNVDDLPNNNSPRTDDPANPDPAVPASSDRWLVGEDLGDVARQALFRDMWRPEAARGIVGGLLDGDPARVSSDFYYCGTDDNGGVHTNSGVPNHAFAMLTDGQTYNGQTVNGLGFIKTTQLYYRAMTVYQTPTSNFVDHANALAQSCQDLLGQNLTDFQTGQPSGQMLTTADCAEIEKAMLAVEMREEPVQCNYQPLLAQSPPAICGAGETPGYLLNETWEGAASLTERGWTIDREAAAAPAGDGFEAEDYRWTLTDALPDNRNGSAIFAIDELSAGTCQAGAGDISGHFWTDSPEVAIAAEQTRVRFDHWVATELNYDGGNLKISVNGGAFEVVPPEAYEYNAPNTELDPGASDLGSNTNPLAGQAAWSGTDGGGTDGSWGTTVVNLALLEDGDGNPLVSPGDTIQLRWDFGIDGCNGVTGWYVDNVSVYACEAVPTAISLESVGAENGSRALPFALVGLVLVGAVGIVILRLRRTTDR